MIGNPRLEGLKKILGADSLQWVYFGEGETAQLLDDCSPTPEIAENLLRSAGDLPSLAGESDRLVNSYRFGGQLVHLIALKNTAGQWLLAWLRLAPNAPTEPIFQLLEWASPLLAQPSPKETEQTPADFEMAPVIASMAGSESEEDRWGQFCRWFAEKTGQEQVFLAHRQWNGWRVVGSARQSLGRNAPIQQTIRQALTGRGVDSALAELARQSAQTSAEIVPLGNRASLVVAGVRREFPPEITTHARHLHTIIRGPISKWERTAAKWRTQGPIRRSLVVATPLLLAGILCIPISDRIRADVILEPSLRRFVASPFNATLQEIHVRAGDVVEVGDLLIELDGREVNERLAEVDARLTTALLQNATELESANYTEASIKALDAIGLQHERDLLMYQRENLKLNSPIRGVVITGELERSQGVAVELGRPLLELAPLNPLVAEIAVEEMDIPLVHPGQEVKIQLHAFPDDSNFSTVTKIHPRSETRDGRNVFVVEVGEDNDDGLLRPGMKGRAVIYGDKKPIFQVLLRKPWQMLRRWSFR